MGRIVHVSDLHFGRASKSKVSVLLSQVNEDLPDLVAISGDLTQRAREPEFEAGRAFLAGLRSPYLVVPGNVPRLDSFVPGVPGCVISRMRKYPGGSVRISSQWV